MSGIDLLSMGRSCIDLYSNDVGAPFVDVTSFGAYVGGCPTNISVGTLKPSPTISLTTYLPGITTASFPKDFNRGYYQSWNFFVQREFSPTLVAEVGYAGTHGVHIHQIVNINAAAPNTGTAGRQLYPYLTTDLNQYTPFGDMT